MWFGGLEYRGLFQPDEGRYAEISREMLASGDWITPRLNGLKYFEKPPLQYWATAVSFALFGEDEWTARLWTAVTGFLGLLLVVFAGNRSVRRGRAALPGWYSRAAAPTSSRANTSRSTWGSPSSCRPRCYRSCSRTKAGPR